MPKYFSERGQKLITKPVDQCQVDLFSGSLNYIIPLLLTPARGLEPSLSLLFSSETQNSIIGLGGSLSVPSISRSIQYHIPYYDNDRDTFTSSWGQLVANTIKKGQSKKGKKWTVRYYQARLESHFAQLAYWENEADTNDSYWFVKTKDGINHIFGKTSSGRLFDKDAPSKVFLWGLEETFDAKGNKITYAYEKAANESQHYLTKISYGNLDKKNYAFTVIFDYGESGLTQWSKQDLQTPTAHFHPRIDPFTSYASGFLITTTRLCRNILLTHQFPHLFDDRPFLVSGWELNYRRFDPESPNYMAISQLESVQQHGYKKLSTGNILKKSLPPIQLTYITSELAWENECLSTNTFQLPKNAIPPGNLLPFRFVDLYQEGLPGILYSDDISTLFWRNNGDGTFGEPVLLPSFPIERTLNSRRCQLMSFPENEYMGFVVGERLRGGYYTYLDDKGWDNYHPFQHYPTDFINPQAEFVDLNGSGYSDLVILNRQAPYYYASLGEVGFSPPQPMSLRPQNSTQPLTFPTNQLTSLQEVVTFANILGDGLQHRVRITQNTIEYWPNLGQGCFGDKVTLNNNTQETVPDFGKSFDARRLFLANINGVGGVDLVYMNSRTVSIYFNLQGQGFTLQPIIINLPDIYTHHDQIHFVDLFGKGIPCLVFTKFTYKGTQHYYYDFAKKQRPYLLNTIENSMGLKTTIEYTSSVQCYTQDRKDGRMPRYKCLRPSTVVNKVTYYDLVTQLKLISRYRFHDGRYDPLEHSFVGFGFVEHWDSEEAPDNTGNEALYAPICHTKYWYHCGALSFYADDASILNSQILSDFNAQDFYTQDADAWLPLPDTQLISSNNAPWILNADNSNTPENLRQARYALRGQLLRQEIYSKEYKKPENQTPISVTTHNYTLRCLKISADQERGIFSVLPRETLTYDYECNVLDPRIQHTLNLSWDTYNHILTTCTLYYPRRGDITYPSASGKQEADKRTYQAASLDVYRQQKATRIIATFFQFQNTGVAPEAPFQFLGTLTDQAILDVPIANQSNHAFLLLGKTLASFNTMSTLLNSTPKTDKDVLMRKSYRYWKKFPLPLLKYSETLIETEEALSQTYGHNSLSQLTPETLNNRLKTEAGYVLNNRNSSWRRLSDVTLYADKKGFYLPIGSTSWSPDLNHPNIADPWYSKKEMRYDTYYLVQQSAWHYLYHNITLKPVTLVNVTDIDYHVCAPRALHDANQIFNEVLYDPLGVAVAFSTHGTVGETPMGNKTLPESLLEKSFTDPENYLNGYLTEAGRILMYRAYATPQSPLSLFHFSTAHYQQALSDLAPSPLSPATSDTQVIAYYYDGLGNIAQTKTKADFEHVIETQWLTSGYAMYNNKGLIVKQYLPYYASTMHYNDQERKATTEQTPETRTYDAMNRLLCIYTPKGFYSEVIYSAWYEWHFDLNDRYDKSSYYKGLSTNSPEKKQLDTLTYCLNTPSVKIFDTLSKPFLSIEVIQSSESSAELLSTYTSYNALGSPLAIQDPRFSNPNIVTFTYDKSGGKLTENNGDTGPSLCLYNRYGNIAYQWNSRHFQFKFMYDNWQRPVEKHVQGGNIIQPFCYEKIEYGDLVLGTLQSGNNLCGHIYQHYDQAGISKFPQYDVHGNHLLHHRQFYLLNDEENRDIDCNQDDRNLSIETLTQHLRFTPFDRILQQQQDNGSTYFFDYNPLKRINAVWITPSPQSQAIPIIKKTRYEPTGHQALIEYGNGMESHFNYETSTQHLLSLETQPFQKIDYQYDPMGNIINMDDSSIKHILVSLSPQTESMQYDSCYRLQSSSRRAPKAAFFQMPPNQFKLFSQLKDEQETELFTSLHEKFQYDKANNISNIDQSLMGVQTTLEQKLHISPDSNRLIEIEPSNNADSITFDYDAQGNLKNLDHQTTLSWNHLNQLVSFEDSSRQVKELYFYNAFGRRVRKLTIESGFTTETLFLRGYEIKRRRNSDTSAVHTSIALRLKAGHRCVATYRIDDDPSMPQGLVYHLDNYLRSVTVEVDNNAKLLTYEAFSAYGETTFFAALTPELAADKTYRYSKEEYDYTTGLYYYGARYYSPKLARWLSPDPIGLIAGLNRYAFVNDDPESYWDYWGYIRIADYKDWAKTAARARGADPTATPAQIAQAKIDIDDTIKDFGIPNEVPTGDKKYHDHIAGQIRVDAQRDHPDDPGGYGEDEIAQTSHAAAWLKRAAKMQRGVDPVSKINVLRNDGSGAQDTIEITHLSLLEHLRVRSAYVPFATSAVKVANQGHVATIYKKQKLNGDLTSPMTKGSETKKTEDGVHNQRTQAMLKAKNPADAMLDGIEKHIELTAPHAEIQTNYTQGYHPTHGNLSITQNHANFCAAASTARDELKEIHNRVTTQNPTLSRPAPFSPQLRPVTGIMSLHAPLVLSNSNPSEHGRTALKRRAIVALPP